MDLQQITQLRFKLPAYEQSFETAALLCNGPKRYLARELKEKVNSLEFILNLTCGVISINQKLLVTKDGVFWNNPEALLHLAHFESMSGRLEKITGFYFSYNIANFGHVEITNSIFQETDKNNLLYTALGGTAFVTGLIAAAGFVGIGIPAAAVLYGIGLKANAINHKGEASGIKVKITPTQHSCDIKTAIRYMVLCNKLLRDCNLNSPDKTIELVRHLDHFSDVFIQSMVGKSEDKVYALISKSGIY